jgi:hypothetical protein
VDYVVETENPDNIAAVNGFSRAHYARTGFLMIRRCALEKKCQYYSSLQFRHEHSITGALVKSTNRSHCLNASSTPKLEFTSAKTLVFAEAGRTWVAKYGLIWNAASIMLGRLRFMAMSRHSFVPSERMTPRFRAYG